MGERTVEGTGNVWFEDLTNNVKCTMFMITYKKSGFFVSTETGNKDEVYGTIYKCAPINQKISAKVHYSRNAKDIKDVKHIPKGEIEEEICGVEGSWLSHLDIDGKRYWDINDPDMLPYRQIPDKEDVLPSDSRYREDMIWLHRRYMSIAHNWKVRMEEQQRHDRRCRQKCIAERQKGKK